MPLDELIAYRDRIETLQKVVENALETEVVGDKVTIKLSVEKANLLIGLLRRAALVEEASRLECLLRLPARALTDRKALVERYATIKGLLPFDTSKDIDLLVSHLGS